MPVRSSSHVLIVCSPCKWGLRAGSCHCEENKSLKEAQKRESVLPNGAFDLLWPSVPTQKADAEIADYRVKGVNLAKLHLAVLNAGRAHSVQEAQRERTCLNGQKSDWGFLTIHTGGK